VNASSCKPVLSTDASRPFNMVLDAARKDDTDRQTDRQRNRRLLRCQMFGFL
jgi:hypothetical protein